MAQKRMLSMKIVDSDAFLEMPLSSQCLYFHLNMRADDDGFVGNPKKIMRMIQATEDDLKILLAKRFLIMFEDSVVVIKHWWIHNTLSKDRYSETTYIDDKAQLFVKENKAYTLNPSQSDTPAIEARTKETKELPEIPAYIQEPFKSNKSETQEFLQECFKLIIEHNKTSVHKIPVSRDYITFLQSYKEGRELLELTRKVDISDLRIALGNYLKVAKSKTWMNTFSISVFCKNYIEYTKEFFDMKKYINIPKDKVKLINDMLDNAIQQHIIFRQNTFIYHRKDWFALGMPEGKELQGIVAKWEEEDVKNNVNYHFALIDWEKDTE